MYVCVYVSGTRPLCKYTYINICIYVCEESQRPRLALFVAVARLFGPCRWLGHGLGLARAAHAAATAGALHAPSLKLQSGFRPQHERTRGVITWGT